MMPESYQIEYAATLPGSDLPWLAELRRNAAARFTASGLPDRKVEEWRYTDLKGIKDRLFAVDDAAAADMPPARLAGSFRMVFTNGALAEAATNLPDGVRLLGMAEALREAPDRLAASLAEDDTVRHLPLPSLNQAMSRDGYVLIVDPGVILERPIEILFLNQSGALYPRNLIIAGAGAQVSVLEHYLGQADGDYVVNGVTEIQAEAGSQVKRYKIQDEVQNASHIATLSASLAEGAAFENFDFNLGGRLARSEIHVALNGEGAAADLSGIYLLRGEQHCDNAIQMDHVVGATNSQQDYRGILDDRAHGVFQGKITVRPDAQGIDGHQLNKTLLLSDKAEIDSKPELEILADDVKCSHGATAGELDESGLFYLRSRGIPEQEAQHLLMTAFVSQTLDKIGDDAVRDVMDQLVMEWMGS